MPPRPDIPERTPTPTINKLAKRVNANVAALWSSIPGGELVRVGAWQKFNLDPAKDQLISTQEYYGCTILVIHDGKNAMLGHFKQAQGPMSKDDDTLKSVQKTQNNIIEPTGEYEALVDADSNTRAWIVAPSDSNTAVGTKALIKHLTDSEESGGYGINKNNVKYQGYTRGGENEEGHFPGQARGKTIIRWTHKPDGSGATMDIFAGNNDSIFSQEYDCAGNPVGGHNKKRDGGSCQAKGGGSPAPTPKCLYIGPEPPGQPEASCQCNGKNGYPLTTLSKNLAPESSCAWSTLPPTMTAKKDPLGPPTTHSKECQVCTRAEYNEDSCHSIPNCIKELAQASVQAGSSPVHVGTLTDKALSTSISSALDKICPSVTDHSVTACSTEGVSIDHIDYKDDQDALNHWGSLEVTVEASSYNETNIRKAMIDAAALTAMKSAVGSNCYEDEPLVEPMKLKRAYNAFANAYNSLTPPSIFPRMAIDEPYPDKVHWCNAAGFAGVNYYGEYARLAQHEGATDWLDARWEFHVESGDKFDCEFLGELIDAMAVVQPEFAIADMSLGEAVSVTCDAIENISSRRKRDVLSLPAPPLQIEGEET